MTSQVIEGDCVELMRSLDEASVDAVVCDPPYGLEFMGKEWDRLDLGAGVRHRAAYNGRKEWHEAWATEALRVLKPGGHLLAFGGTRTYHRLACAVEDAGFEIRDSLIWLYGSGFPKSLDVSKAIDKRGGADIGWFGPWLRQKRLRSGVTAKALCAAIGEHGEVNHGGAVSNWEKGYNLPTAEQFNKICDALGLDFERIEEAEREKVGEKDSGLDSGSGTTVHLSGSTGRGENGLIPITAPATPEAQQWQGWGTALKPSHEPVVVARKPLSGTVAANVLVHGTGALNVDGCRVDGSPPSVPQPILKAGNEHERGLGASNGRNGDVSEASGRWPSNVILSPDSAAELDEQSGELKSPGSYDYSTPDTGNERKYGGGKGIPKLKRREGFADTGGASRFFFTARTSAGEATMGICDVNTAGSSSPPSNPPGDSAQSDVATGERPEDSPLTTPAHSQAPSTNATPSESSKRGASDTPTTPSSEPKSSPASKPPKPSPTSNPANPAEPSEPTDTTTTTPSHLKSGGSAEAATSEDTLQSWVPGVLDSSEPRFRYTAKASRGERNAGLEGFEEVEAATLSGGNMTDQNGRAVQGRAGKAVRQNHHPTVKPIDLMRWLCRLVTPPGGTVLDPFTGSGTTGIAAHLEGFNFIGIEREAEYAAIAKARIEWWAKFPPGTDVDKALGIAAVDRVHSENGQGTLL